MSLFGEDKAATRPPLPQMSAWGATERLDEELKAIGFYLSGHPLDGVLIGTARERITLAADIAETARRKSVIEMIGIVRSRVEKPAMKGGGKLAYVTISDPSGAFEVMVLPETLFTVRDVLEPGAAVHCMIRVKIRDDDVKLSLEAATPLDDASIGATGGLIVGLDGLAEIGTFADTILNRLANLNAPEKGEIRLEVRLAGGDTVLVRLNGKYPVNSAAARMLKAFPGVRAVSEISA